MDSGLILFGISPVWSGFAALVWIGVFQALGWSLWQVLWRGARSDTRYLTQSCGQIPTGLLALFFQQVLGMGGAMLLLLLLAVCGLFHWPGVAMAGAVTVGFAAVLRYRGSAIKTVGASDHALVTLPEWCALACAVLLSVAVSWRFPGAWDDTSYHLPLARSIVEHQSLVANEWLRFPYFPAFMHLLFAGGLLVDTWLAQWLATWPVAVTLLGLMGTSRWVFGHAAWGVFAWALYICTPALGHSLGFAYVDAGLALFCMAAVLGVALWARSSAQEHCTLLMLAGLCAGFAGGIKFHGLVVAGALVSAVLIVSLVWGPGKLAVGRVLAFGVPCGMVAVFWYARSYWVTGDPIHPAGASIFGYYLWTEQDLALQVAEQATHGLAKQWVNFLPGIWHAHVPYLYAAFGLPLLLIRGNRRFWFVVGFVVWVNVLFWFWISQVDRYLVPVLPLAAFLCMALVRGLVLLATSSTLGRIPTYMVMRCFWMLALACAVYLASSSLMQWHKRAPLSMQREGFSEIALLHRAEELSPQYGERVLNMGYENAFFYYRGQLIGDWFGQAAFPRIADCSPACRMRPPLETQKIMQDLGVRLVLIHSGKFPFDEAQYSSQLVLLGKSGPGVLYGIRPTP